MPTVISYPVVETFHSVQGEGAWAGTNAVFIRLGGCDVHCRFCDTKESWNVNSHPLQPVHDIADTVGKIKPAIAVITGGEPLMHNLDPLTDSIRLALGKTHISIHLETSGAYPKSGNFDWVTLSPKTFKPPHPSVYAQVQELKIVVSSESDLQWAELQSSLVDLSTLKYLQPQWGNPEAQELTLNYVLAHPQWRLSLQTHKYLGVR
ncbi:organic radical activating enzyme [Synechococcus sp. PCC 7502]|uniref:7-carboxy-7-deazaguanine synthase QueE n=1 Tax=Synechococcus sp. PCC 7502 TaxID=1173263 RepID=UPI00029FB63E|nr:7-carboxy-7-deazaguanine synthase QueE [Synechococcus sp. PCC 7502]AFY74661.1 organic radical activating enzyme [Synechococcus sp. PCC 7502]